MVRNTTPLLSAQTTPMLPLATASDDTPSPASRTLRYEVEPASPDAGMAQASQIREGNTSYVAALELPDSRRGSLVGKEAGPINELTTLRAAVWTILHRKASRYGRITKYWPSRVFESAMIFMIIASLVVLGLDTTALGDTEKENQDWYKVRNTFEGFAACFFTIEYLLRLWSCVEHRDYRGWKAGGDCKNRYWLGRLHWAKKPLSLLDLVCLVPFWLDFLTDESSSLSRVRGATALFAVRLLQVFALLRLERELKSFKRLAFVMHTKSTELIIALFTAVVMMVISSSVLFFVEHPGNHEFKTLGNAIWWSVSALTTVGYGDTVPTSPTGQALAGLTSFLGIFLFALPTGILGAGFVEVFVKEERVKIAQQNQAMHRSNMTSVDMTHEAIWLSSPFAIDPLVDESTRIDSQEELIRCLAEQDRTIQLIQTKVDLQAKQLADHSVLLRRVVDLLEKK